MNERWAEENLAVIRTLMERTAIYRRALAPVMLVTGTVGTAAGVAAFFWEPQFILYWTVVAVVVMAVAFYLTRRQAMKEGETFWSPPARRVVSAMAPSLLVAAVLTLVVRMSGTADDQNVVLVWVLLYGCAIHAAGFFAPARLRVLGWAFIIGGAALIAVVAVFQAEVPLRCAHALMGVFFGVLHLAFGAWLFATPAESTAH